MKLFIATPSYGRKVYTDYLSGMIDLSHRCAKEGIKLYTYLPHHFSIISEARNFCVKKFLQSEATHLIFIDADIGFEGKDVIRLAQHDVDVVAGIYARKKIEWPELLGEAKERLEQSPTIDLQALFEDTAFYFTGLKAHEGYKLKYERSEKGLVNIDRAPTGFMCIKREALDKYVAHYKGNIGYLNPYAQEQMWAVFDHEIDKDTKYYNGEDYFFCKRFKQMGGTIWADPDIRLKHIGNFEYLGNFATQCVS